VERPPQRFHSFLAGPIGCRAEQSFGHGIILDDLEEAKDGHFLSQVLVGAMVNGRHDGAHQFALAVGQKRLSLTGLWKKALRCGSSRASLSEMRGGTHRGSLR
jgi:hypothetical protein